MLEVECIPHSLNSTACAITTVEISFSRDDDCLEYVYCAFIFLSIHYPFHFICKLSCSAAYRLIPSARKIWVRNQVD